MFNQDEENKGMFSPDEVLEETPIQAGRLVPESQANDQAFFTAKLNPPGYSQQIYDDVKFDLTTTGYSEALKNAQDAWVDEQDYEKRAVIGALIEDETVPKEDKIKLLNEVSYGYINPDLKYKYATEVASLDNSDTLIEREAQETAVDEINQNLVLAEQERKAEDDNDYIQDSLGELLSIANIGAATFAGTTDMMTRTVRALYDYTTTGEVDWEKIQNTTEDLETGFSGEGFLKGANTLSIRPFADLFGLADDFDESYINKVFSKVGEGFEWLADKVVEKGIIDDKDKAMFVLEALGFALPPGYVGARVGLKTLTHKKAGGADTTIKANPKKAGDDLADAVKEPSSQKAKEMNTTDEAIIAKHILPKADDNTPVDTNSVDINKRLEESMGETNMNDRLVQDITYDHNLVNRQARLDDVNRKKKIAEQSSFHQNVAASRHNMTGSKLEGKMVFTQTPDYAFQSKGAAIKAAEDLKSIADNLAKQEIAADLKSGITSVLSGTKVEGVRSNVIKDTVVVRDIKSNQVFTLDELKASKLGKRQFQVEYEFKKNYDLLADEMLGQSFANIEIPSLLFGKKLGTMINRTRLGEFIFGTGFTAKWFEQARQAISPKSGAIVTDVVKEFNNLVAKNKNLRKELHWAVQSQSKYKTDHISKVRLSKAFRHLSQEKINKLDEMQTSWRRTQDRLYEITNQGEKSRLLDSGYNKGAFIKGKYVGAVKSKVSSGDLEGLDIENLKVYDPMTDKYVTFKRNKSIQDDYVDTKGRKIVKIEPKDSSRLRNKDGESSDFMLVKKSDIDILPTRVMPKMKGHSFKEYKSNFFLEVRPKLGSKLLHNGAAIRAADLDKFTETRGTATTKYEADLLRKEMMDETSPNYIGKDYEVLTPRNSKIDDITDYLAEYRLHNDQYQNAALRAEDMRVLEGDRVLVDPLESMNNAARRIVKTGKYKLFEEAYNKKFEQDFKEVLRDGKFPRTEADISAAGLPGDAARLRRLEAEAKSLFRRQTHFQSSAVNLPDVVFQNVLHSLGDVFEKVKIGDKLLLKGASAAARDLGNIGYTGTMNYAKRMASLLYITFQNPLRHHLIQPMMFYEQSLIFPRTFGKTVQRTPLHVVNLLNDSALLKGEGKGLAGFIKNKADRAEFFDELRIMKDQGILESIDQNLAAIEVLKGPTKKLEAPRNVFENIGEKVTAAGNVAKGVFNKAGFASGELTNRVGLWLQTKERWKADPRNKGKDWRDPKNAEEIGFEAWKQSGAMTTAGALGFQRTGFMSFLTQFQSINMKGFMNLIQDNATNLTRADRIKLSAARVMLHGVEYGLPIASGKVVMDYLQQNGYEDIAEEVSRGGNDRFWNQVTSTITGEESDITVSESASLGATNAYADIMESVLNMGRYITGDPDVRAPNIPSVQAASRAWEKLRKAIDIFTYNPVTSERLVGSLSALTEITSVGNNWMKMTTMLASESITSKNGTLKGIEPSFSDAMWQSLGMRTREEGNLWKAEDLKRTIQQRKTDAIEGFDRILVNIMSGDPKNIEKSNETFSLLFDLVEQEGGFTPSDMDDIQAALVSRDKRRFESNQQESLLKWLYDNPSDTKEFKQAISILKDSKDENIKQILKLIEEQ